MALVIVPNKSIATSKTTIEYFDPIGSKIGALNLQYREVEIAVQETVLKTEHTLLLSDIKEGFDIKIEDYLQRIPMSILKAGYPKLDIRMSMYRPLLKAFKYIKLAGKDMHPSQPIEPSEAEDLFVSKMDPIDNVTTENCLFTVNGLFTYARPYLDGVRIMGGGKMIHQTGDLSSGTLIMPNTVTCTPIDSNASEFNTFGDLYVKFNNPDKNYGIVVGGHLHIFGVDSNSSIMGRDYGLFRFDATFILKQIVPYAKVLGLDINFDLMSATALEIEDLKRKILALPTSFLVEFDGSRLYCKTSAVQKWWWDELRHESLGSTHDFYGFVKDRGGRGVDYWGVFSENANILYHTLRLNPEAELYATSIHYEDPNELFTDKYREVPRGIYEAMSCVWYFQRV